MGNVETYKVYSHPSRFSTIKEFSLSKDKSKISDAEKKTIETAISDLKNSLKGTDTEDVKKKTQALIQASMKLGEAVYKSQQKPDGKNKDTKENKEKK